MPPRRTTRTTSGVLALTVAVAAGSAFVAGCAGNDEQVTVLAASSLTDAFGEIELAYEAAHPGVDVVVSYGGSSALAAQVEQGVPADVFAAADLETAARAAASSDSVGGSVVFARNRLVIAVEPGNPAGVTGLADLERDDLVVVLAAPEVPAGNYAAELLAEAEVVVEPSSLEQNVRAVASKVALGEADAGIVYATDVTAQPDRLDAVEIEGGVRSPVADYPVVALTAAGSDFVEFVLSSEGRAALVAAGFEVP